MIERLVLPVTGLSASTFAALSALRKKRIFHPVGVAYLGTIQLFAPKELPLANGTHRVIARFSRGAGTPEPLPDVLGFAFKILNSEEGDQDFLLASSGRAPGARNLLLPSTSFFRATYSSVLPYSVLGAQGDQRPHRRVLNIRRGGPGGRGAQRLRYCCGPEGRELRDHRLQVVDQARRPARAQ